MKKLMTKALEARNREAIQKLAQRDANERWGKSISVEERAEYLMALGKNYMKLKAKQ